MKWIKIKSQTEIEAYELWDNNNKALTFSKLLMGFVKIQTEDTRRTFMIEKKGIFKTRIILRNEYGIRLGQVTYEGNHSNVGIIDTEGQRLRYAIHEDPTNEMVVYNQSNEPMLVCYLENIPGNPHKFPSSPTDNIFPALLLALCWHKFTPVSKEAELEVA